MTQTTRPVPAIALSTPGRPPVVESDFNPWWTVLSAALANFICTVDNQLHSVNLRYLAGPLGFQLDEGSWAAAAFIATQLVAIVLTGRLVRRLGVRFFLTGNALLLTLASVVAIAAPNLLVLFVARALAGFAAGSFLAIALNLVMDQLPVTKRPIGYLVFGIPSTLAIPVGYFLGGWCIENASWHWLYVPAALGGVLLAGFFWYRLRSLPSEPPQPWWQVDWPGLVALIVAACTLATVLQRGTTENWFDSPFIVTISLLSAFAWGLFGWFELHSRHAFIDLRLLARRNFAASQVINAMIGLVLSYTFVVTSFLTQIHGYNSIQIAEVIVWAALVNPLMPVLMKKLDMRVLIALGLACFVPSCLMNAYLSANVAGEQLIWSQVVRALGQPLLIIALLRLAMTGLKASEYESAAQIFNLVRTAASSTATAAMGGWLVWREHFHSHAIVENLGQSYWQSHLQQLAAALVSRGSEPLAATNQATALLKQMTSNQAYILAFGDLFWLLALSMAVIVVALLWVRGSSTVPTLTTVAPPRARPGGGVPG
ncbi:MFS transporter [Gloeobacter kilaueensis]|uniref:EmrB/QacA family drug resistance transporter n=1 Tax=Gloeobacter kilaueensis (strain ATCC BAA-2537 / CCAP 1431/1 / ULC 316 / JS1) TaxID=1183438 RepID=U5QNI0_GLOK1|nr:MFS transporter [Gloeobacter kilaueensis]AGY59159.1 EmrB/QacA family drug resistance transporter [Gloeobacter kilaueensis JS1]